MPPQTTVQAGIPRVSDHLSRDPRSLLGRMRVGDRRRPARTSPSPAALMNSQEIETASAKIPLVVLIWADGVYGLIEWKMDLEPGEHYNVTFTDPDVVKSAECFGANGYRISSAGACCRHRELHSARRVCPPIVHGPTRRDYGVTPAGHGDSGAGDPPLRR
jgi:Thiamine pyrophosphate enzyme, C-terminal TPP binding domain